jgi:lipid A 3-O-deacylase
MRILLATSCATVLAAFASTQTGATTLADQLAEFQRARAQGQATTTVDIDNDTLLLNHHDGFYTSGLRLTREFALDREARGNSAGETVSYGWRAGQELYTASDIKLQPERIVARDHPYAGWLYAGVFRHTREADGGSLRYGVDIGCLGSCALGRETQQTLHRFTRQPPPQGWSSEVRREIGVVLHADVEPFRLQFGRAVDLTPGLQGRFGNIYTDLAGRLMLRFGALQPDPSAPAWQGYARVQARAVGYNASLQGGYFSTDNPHVVDPKRLVGEAEIGVRYMIGRTTWSAAIVRAGNEIAPLSNAIGTRNFGRLQLAIAP